MSVRCPVCGGTGYHDVHVADSPDPVARFCAECGIRAARPGPMFRRWKGREVHMIDPRWSPGPATFVGGLVIPADADPPSVTVWCGPPAFAPEPPRPEQILAAAGLSHLWAGDL